MIYKTRPTQKESQGEFTKSVGVFLAVPKLGASLFYISVNLFIVFLMPVVPPIVGFFLLWVTTNNSWGRSSLWWPPISISIHNNGIIH